MNNADEIVRAAQEAIEHLQGCYEVMSALAEVRKEEIESLQADLARVTAERDAAVEDMREAIFNDRTSSCSFCAHANRDPNTAPYCLANFCANDEWKWRGVKGEQE